MGSHKSILKATAWTGSSQVAVLAMGLARSKLTSVLLGPGGIGLTGTFLTISGFVGGIAELGIPPSGIRAVAEATASNDDARIGRIAAALQAAMLVTGIAGMAATLLLSYPISIMTFGAGDRWAEIALLSVTVLLSSCTSGRSALLQGTQRIRDVARCQMLSTLLGLAATALLLLAFREKGIVAALVANSMAAFIVFRRATQHGPGTSSVHYPWRSALIESKALLALGAAFLFQNLVLGLGGYWSRLLIIKHGGLDALGLYTAAWTLSAYAVQMILAAMGSDFYPRLTAASSDSAEMNRLVNEQIETGVLLSAPALLGMLTMAPVVVSMVFSRDFSGSVPLVRIMCFGAAFRVVAWPIGYIMMARNRKRLFIASEAFAAVSGLSLLSLGLHHRGLEGAGIANALSGLLTGLFLWRCARSVSSFQFSRRCLAIVSGHSLMLGMAFAAMQHLSGTPAVAAGLAITTTATITSLAALNRIVSFNPVRSLLLRWRHRTAPRT